ncbi:glutathione S-transferase family protein [Bradyrhizobium sp. B120]|uniref:glutathione S-transferase family protein n=1 Tax=Bradyrhizobium sp. B120 TaxID=3410088 RepID=UPI003B9824B6
MKLMYAPQSPFARKVRAAAIELGLETSIELTYVEVVPGQPNVEFGQLHNPLRKVPALIVHENCTLFDSTVICEFLDHLAGGAQLIPRDPDKRWAVLTQHALAQGICDAVISIRYETSIRPEDKRWQVWVDDQWDKIFNALTWFDTNPNVFDTPRLNIAHLALVSGVGYIDFRYGENVDWRSKRPFLSAWVEEISKRDCFKKTIPTSPPLGMSAHERVQK